MAKDMFQPALVKEAAGRRIVMNEIRALYRSADKAERECITHLIALGERLARLKESCSHGEWLPLLEELSVNRKTAWRAIKAYKEQFKCLSVRHLTAGMAVVCEGSGIEEEIEESAEPAPPLAADEPEEEPEIPPELAKAAEPEAAGDAAVVEFNRNKLWKHYNLAAEQVEALAVCGKLVDDEDYAGAKADLASLKKHTRSLIKKAEAK